jgi:hypothetical protein
VIQLPTFQGRGSPGLADLDAQLLSLVQLAGTNKRKKGLEKSGFVLKF